MIGFFVFNGIVPRALKPRKTKKTYRRQPVSEYLEHRPPNRITERSEVILHWDSNFSFCHWALKPRKTKKTYSHWAASDYLEYCPPNRFTEHSEVILQATGRIAVILFGEMDMKC